MAELSDKDIILMPLVSSISPQQGERVVERNQGEDKPSPLLWTLLPSMTESGGWSHFVHSRGDGLSSPCWGMYP